MRIQWHSYCENHLNGLEVRIELLAEPSEKTVIPSIDEQNRHSVVTGGPATHSVHTTQRMATQFIPRENVSGRS